MTEPQKELLEGEAYPGEFAKRKELEHKKWIEAENLKITLYGIRTLITGALDGDRPDFLKAKRLCLVADSLRRALGTKVQDFAGVGLPGEVAFECDVDEGAGGVAGLRMGGQMARIGGGGVEDLTRMAVGLLDRQNSRQSAVDTARTHEIAALELETLLKLEPMTQGEQQTRIKKRIEVITKGMEETDGLVHPDVLGGHQAHREGQGQDPGAADRDDGRGAGSAQAAAPQGVEAA